METNNKKSISELLEELRNDPSWGASQQQRNQTIGRLTHTLIDN